jgi:hypothetical protein
MPFGYVISTAVMVAVTWSAIAGPRPRRSSPFRLSGLLGFPLNWPLAVILLIAASTALAIGQSGVRSPGFWVGLGFAILASAGLVILRRRGLGAGRVVEGALDEGLGAGWRHETRDRLRVKRSANIRYGLDSVIDAIEAFAAWATARAGRAAPCRA